MLLSKIRGLKITGRCGQWGTNNGTGRRNSYGTQWDSKRGM